MPYPVTTVTLNQNAINTVLFNMIISQRVFDSGVASTELADRFRVDGTLFGDTKLYHSFDIGSPENWLNDAEAKDLLKLDRNKSGITQSIQMGVYKIIPITTDQYLSKQAFMNDGTFADFTSFLKGSLRKIKKVYDRALINTKLGTLDPSTDDCNITVTTPQGQTLEEQNRLAAQYLAAKLKVLKVDLEDNNRKYNKLNYLRAYDVSDLIAIWNVEQSARITMVDLPTIYHKEFGADGGFKQYELPQKWFGRQLTDADGTSYSDYKLVSNEGHTFTGPPATIPAWSGGKLRIKESGWYGSNVTYSAPYMILTKYDKPKYIISGTEYNAIYLWAGDEVPAGGSVVKNNATGISVTLPNDVCAPVELVYEEDTTIAFTLVHKDALPYMSGFETGTEFWNGRSLTTNNYLIFGHNELEFLEEYPRLVVRVVTEENPSFTPPTRTVDITKVAGLPIATTEGQENGVMPVDLGSGEVDVNLKKVSGTNIVGKNVPININAIRGNEEDIASAGKVPVSISPYNVNDVYRVDLREVGGTTVSNPSGTATEVKIRK